MKKRILITGATGFIGSHLLNALLQENKCEIFALARTTGSHPGVQWIKGDLEQPGFVDQLPAAYDILIHLAQYRDYRNFPQEANAMFQVNVGSFLALMDHARKVGVSRVILTSSANVYALSSGLITEDNLIEATDFYAMNKWVSEQILSFYHEYFDVINLRVFTVYGPGQRNRMIPRLIQSVYSGEVITLAGGTGISVSPLFIDDLIHALLRFIEIPVMNTVTKVNIGGTSCVTIREISEEIGIITGRKPVFQMDEGKSGLGWCASMDRLKEMLPDFSSVPLKDGLTKTCQELIRNMVD